MAKTMYCPFIITDYADKRGDYKLRCERGKLQFADRDSFNDFVCDYCGSEGGWKTCTMAKSLQKDYEREDEK